MSSMQRRKIMHEIKHSIIATIRQQTGKRYLALEKAMEDMDVQALLALQTYVRDMDYEIQARKNAWRRDLMRLGH
jgi:hypothetical protein